MSLIEQAARRGDDSSRYESGAFCRNSCMRHGSDPPERRRARREICRCLAGRRKRARVDGVIQGLVCKLCKSSLAWLRTLTSPDLVSSVI